MYVVFVAATMATAVVALGSCASSDLSREVRIGPDAADVFPTMRFSHSLTIDNKWAPQIPGTETDFTGNVREGSKLVPHQIVSIVTDLSKWVDGVQTTVVWERDYSVGKLAESELFFTAQDDAGTVWLLGEYPEIYDGGPFQGAPSTWLAGVSGAKPGIFMPAAPQLGKPRDGYSQGIALKVGFYDRAQVFDTNQRVCVPIACYSDVLVVDEWGPLAPNDGHQRKSYVQGIGGILVRPVGGDQQEGLALTKIAHLSLQQLAQIRTGALDTEKRAYSVSDSYRSTPPALPRI